LSKSRKQKRIFKNPLTKAELEGATAYGLSRELQPHQRLEFAKAMSLGTDAGEGDLSYAQSLAKKAQGFLTPEDRRHASRLSEKAMDLAEKAKLKYGRERITAAKAVAFIKDEWMRDFATCEIAPRLGTPFQAAGLALSCSGKEKRISRWRSHCMCSSLRRRQVRVAKLVEPSALQLIP
jgi:hypothetical protein